MFTIAHAAAADVAKTFVDQINEIIIFPLIILLSGIAILVFLWGGFQYVFKASDPAARTQGQKHLLWGVIGLLIMVSAYAILTIAANTFGIDPKADPRDTFEGVITPAGSFEGATRPTTDTGSSFFGGSGGATESWTDDLVSDPRLQSYGEYQYLYDDLVENGIENADEYMESFTSFPSEDIVLMNTIGIISDETMEQLIVDLDLTTTPVNPWESSEGGDSFGGSNPASLTSLDLGYIEVEMEENDRSQSYIDNAMFVLSSEYSSDQDKINTAAGLLNVGAITAATYDQLITDLDL